MTINAVLTGTLHPSVGRVISSLANSLLKVMDLADLEKRLEAVEDKLENRRD